MLLPFLIALLLFGGLMILLPWGLKLLMKAFFRKEVRYFTCFWIALVVSMIGTGILNYLHPQQ